MEKQLMVKVEWDGWYLRPVNAKNIYWARVFSGVCGQLGFGAQFNTIPVDENNKKDLICLDEWFETPETAMLAIEKKLGIAS